MAYLVGRKGQVVINKEIRDRLGVEAGWQAIQRLVDDHVEVYFLPPAHKRSLKGVLRGYLEVRIASGDQWDRARDAAWENWKKEPLRKRKQAR